MPSASEHPLLRRQAALESTVARFGSRAFAWGEADCWLMGRYHLRQLGHRPPATPRYRSALGARRALRTNGFDSLIAALDSMLPRISPAAMLPGDLAAMPGTDGLDALVICGGKKVFGWHEDAAMPVFIVPLENGLACAWRVFGQ